jgi:hypothetical protein
MIIIVGSLWYDQDGKFWYDYSNSLIIVW